MNIQVNDGGVPVPALSAVVDPSASAVHTFSTSGIVTPPTARGADRARAAAGVTVLFSAARYRLQLRLHQRAT